MSPLKITLNNEEEMITFGFALAKVATPPLVIFLYGELGAGKTTFVRGFLRGCQYEGIVKSPTYTLVETYELPPLILHFDLYRVHDPLELEYMGIQDYFKPPTICFIEWPQNGLGTLPDSDLSCYIEHAHDGRLLTMVANTNKGNVILERLNYGQ